MCVCVCASTLEDDSLMCVRQSASCLGAKNKGLIVCANEPRQKRRKITADI